MRISESRSSSSSSGSFGGSHIAKPDCNLFTYNLGWDHPTVFKPFACPTDDMRGLLPYRKPNDPDQLTDWVYPISHYVKAAGQTRKISFNAALPQSESNYAESPYERFYRVLNQLSKSDAQAKAALEPLFKGGAGRGAAIPKMKRTCMMQGVLYMHGNSQGLKDYSASPKINILLVLSPSAAVSMFALFDAKDSAQRPILPGDLFDNQPPKLLHFLKSSNAPMLPPGWTIIADPSANTPSQPTQMGAEVNYHKVRLVTPPQGVNLPTPQTNLQMWKSWDKIALTLPVEAQIALMCSAFDPFLMKKAFEMSEFEQFLPAYVKSAQMMSVPAAIPAPMPVPQPMPSMGGSPFAVPQPQAYQQPQQAYQQPMPQAYPQQAPQGYPQMQAAPFQPTQGFMQPPQQQPQQMYQPPTQEQYVPAGFDTGGPEDDVGDVPTMGAPFGMPQTAYQQPMPAMPMPMQPQVMAQPAPAVDAAKHDETMRKLQQLNEARNRMHTVTGGMQPTSPTPTR